PAASEDLPADAPPASGSVEEPAREEIPAPQAASPPPQVPAVPERLAPTSPREGSARDQVREDGSLIQPRAEGPLARLRQRFAP
ncbi:hypothetical protein, partial [Aphanothece microscopica]